MKTCELPNCRKRDVTDSMRAPRRQGRSRRLAAPFVRGMRPTATTATP